MIDVTDALQHVDLAIARRGVPHVSRAAGASARPAGGLRSRVRHVLARAHGTQHSCRARRGRRFESRPGVRSSGRLPGEVDPADEGASSPALMQTWSDVGGLADKDFGEFSADEIVRARLALDRLVWSPGERRTRRWIPRARLARGSAARAGAQPAHRRRRDHAAAADAARPAAAASSCCATSADRWSATRGCCCTSRTR